MDAIKRKSEKKIYSSISGMSNIGCYNVKQKREGKKQQYIVTAI